MNMPFHYEDICEVCGTPLWRKDHECGMTRLEKLFAEWPKKPEPTAKQEREKADIAFLKSCHIDTGGQWAFGLNELEGNGEKYEAEKKKREVAALEALLNLSSDIAQSVPAADSCGICGGLAVFDERLDLNTCSQCGAFETAEGWIR